MRISLTTHSINQATSESELFPRRPLPPCSLWWAGSPGVLICVV
jgi:hypothetical protein